MKLLLACHLILVIGTFLPTGAAAVEISPERSTSFDDDAKFPQAYQDSAFMRSVPLFEDCPIDELRLADRTENASILQQIFSEIQEIFASAMEAARQFLVRVLRYLLGLLEPSHAAEPVLSSPKSPVAPTVELFDPVVLQVDSPMAQRTGGPTKKKSASDESLDTKHCNYEPQRPTDSTTSPGFSKSRRKSASCVERPIAQPAALTDSGNAQTAQTLAAPAQRPQAIKRHRSASATPSSPHYTVPTVSSINMKSPVTGRRRSSLTRRKKSLELEREEKLESLRRENRKYKNDVYRQLEEQQEERAKYMEGVRKTKGHKLSESMQ